ncbi:MAG TPA: phage holin family protein [Gaiellaceae bacterium]|nr:phage holin family protein [Gaiellaceae bacterium]
MNGLSSAARRVSEHARSIVQLELRLALSEMKRKAAALAAGIGIVVAAALLGLFALVFGLAAATAGIATALPVWLALLVMFGGLLVTAGVLGAIGIGLLGKGSKPVPEKAIEEARLTTEALRNGR